MSIYKFVKKLRRGLHRLLVEPFTKMAFKKCGKNVRVPSGCSFSGIENVEVGNNVAFGSGLKVLSTRAKVLIGNDVMLGPNVTVITGDHRIDILDCPLPAKIDRKKDEKTE